jgi:hypothetical protein
MRYYTTESLGPRQRLTPEGYLLCEGVAIARTGAMIYGEGEIPVTAKDGLIRVERDAAAVFHPDTIASFEGKPLTIDHPSEDVTPANWRTLAVGIVQNVRRGAATDNDLLIADLLVTDADAIKEVRAGLREVSCGYDADYEEIQPGQGRQTNIFGNHLALVEQGRCGTRCAIGDKDPMKKTTWMDRLRTAFKAGDAAEFEKTLKEDKDTKDAEAEEEKKKDDEEEKKKTSDTLSKILDKITALDARVSALDKKSKDEDEEDKDEKEEAKTGDSAALVSEAQDVFARAEILSPGLHMPTVDAKTKGGLKKTSDALCGLRRKALQTAFEGKHRDAVTPFLGATPEFKTLTCDAIRSAFVGASEIVRLQNNGAQKTGTFDASKNAASISKSVSAINAANREFWKRS